MNLIKCYVTELVGEPFEKTGFWYKRVKFDSYGVINETYIVAKTKEACDKIIVGFEFES